MAVGLHHDICVMLVNNRLIRPYLLGEGGIGGGCRLKFP